MSWRYVFFSFPNQSRKTSSKIYPKEVRYYISSIDNNAKEFAMAVRGHWGIENSVHWLLDVAFREDESRMRKGHSAENFALIRRIALNLLKQEKTLKKGKYKQILMAGLHLLHFQLL